MSYIPGVDYFVYYEKLPWAIRGMVTPNEDSTFTIVLNSRYPELQRLKAYRHEKDHIENEDFYNCLPVEMVEDL